MDSIQVAEQPWEGLASLAGPQAAGQSRAYRGYVVFLFALVAMLGMADQYSLSILLQPIKTDLRVSDTTIGVLTGVAFAMVYAIAGIPLARLADMGNRRNLLAGLVVFWSAATALCGAVTNIGQLFVARMALAVGESGLQPTIVSMIGDLFSPRRRGLVIALFMMGGSVGLLLGSVLAGVIGQEYGWRTVFVILGLPGILVGLLLYLTVPEPVRGQKERAEIGHRDTATMLSALRYLASVPTAWRLIIASTLLLSTQGAWAVWVPTFFLRVHGMSLKAMSASFGLFMGLGAVSSMVLSGFASDWLAARGEAWRVRFLGVTLLLGIPIVIAVLLVDNVWVAWALIVAFQVITAGAPPIVSAAGVGVVRPQARGLWTSLYYLGGSGIGGLCGPLLVGWTTDRLTHRFGDVALRYSLMVIPALLLPAALVYFWASLSANRDARRARGEAEAEGTAP